MALQELGKGTPKEATPPREPIVLDIPFQVFDPEGVIDMENYQRALGFAVGQTVALRGERNSIGLLEDENCFFKVVVSNSNGKSNGHIHVAKEISDFPSKQERVNTVLDSVNHFAKIPECVTGARIPTSGLADVVAEVEFFRNRFHLLNLNSVHQPYEVYFSNGRIDTQDPFMMNAQQFEMFLEAIRNSFEFEGTLKQLRAGLKATFSDRKDFFSLEFKGQWQDQDGRNGIKNEPFRTSVTIY